MSAKFPTDAERGVLYELVHDVDAVTDVADKVTTVRELLAPLIAAREAAARAEAWDEGWDAAVDAAERCDVAGKEFTCGECAICTQGNPYRQETDDD